jgi:hypothetical protein
MSAQETHDAREQSHTILPFPDPPTENDRAVKEPFPHDRFQPRYPPREEDNTHNTHEAHGCELGGRRVDRVLFGANVDAKDGDEDGSG